MTRMEIVERRPLRGVLQTILVVTALAACAYLLVVDRPRAPAPVPSPPPPPPPPRSALERQVDALLAERDELLRRIAILERGDQVARKAYEDVQEHVADMQDELLDLREQVAFYEGIVSSPARERLRIQTLGLDRAGPGNAWRFQVVLTRNTKSDTVLTGNVELAVHGEQRGEARQLSLTDLTTDRSGALAFQFRYFQRLEGRLILPPGFVPQRVVVHVTEDGSSEPPVERSFDWPAPVS